MRFSLRSLIAVVVIAAIMSAFVATHGLFGMVLVLPHLILLAVVVLLNRRAHRLVASLVAGVYLACWGLTIAYGTQAATEHCLNRLHFDSTARLTRDPYEGHDALEFTPSPAPTPPWFFVGMESAPSPFVVVMKVSCEDETGTGFGETAYFLWTLESAQLIHTCPGWWSEGCSNVD
jgi:hypothetical protein